MKIRLIQFNYFLLYVKQFNRIFYILKSNEYIFTNLQEKNK